MPGPGIVAAVTTAAGLVMYRRRGPVLEVLLVHPGGPFWKNKDDGAWSIPKGECEAREATIDAAQREFREETGFAPTAPFHELGTVRTRGKTIVAWAFEGDCDPSELRSNTFTMEWPPRSGREQSFPEVDRAAWFALDHALVKLLPAQQPFLQRLGQSLGV